MPNYDPSEMAGTVARMAKALRQVPVRVSQMESELDYAARMVAWREEHAEAIEDAEKIEWVNEIQRFLVEQEPYTK